MDMGDLTSITENLLDNAFRAASKPSSGNIDFCVLRANDNVVIKCVNSCSPLPQFYLWKLFNNESNYALHGFGLKIIKEKALKYGGSVTTSYDEDSKKFCTEVWLFAPIEK